MSLMLQARFSEVVVAKVKLLIIDIRFSDIPSQGNRSVAVLSNSVASMCRLTTAKHGLKKLCRTKVKRITIDVDDEND